MAFRDYGPGYRGRDDRDIERGRYGEREQERYVNYGRERWEPLSEREYRGESSSMYDEGFSNRDVESGRWNRERDYGDAGRERGVWGTGGNGGRGDIGYRERVEGRGMYENRGIGRRREFEGGRPFDRGYASYGGYGETFGYGPTTGYGLTSSMRESTRPNFTGRGPKGYRRSDDAIRDEVNELLTRHPEIDASDVEVRVENADVILTGIVEDRRAKRLAEDIAEDVWGVNDVRNELKIRHGFLAKLTGEQADEREISRATSRETTGAIAGTETTRRAGRSNATVGTGSGTTGT